QPIREQRPAEAWPSIKVPLPFHLDRPGTRFLEGCPANPGAFSAVICATNRKAPPWHFPDLSNSYGKPPPGPGVRRSTEVRLNRHASQFLIEHNLFGEPLHTSGNHASNHTEIS